uniref:Uncharacterized protein n=1 Tax=Spongospora subterranea TaxID=70186 RepID=A0A0H5RAI5_9EUKA|eukprot:CRZ05464.1 hypothetical protein [Spongospora subterranea]
MPAKEDELTAAKAEVADLRAKLYRLVPEWKQLKTTVKELTIQKAAAVDRANIAERAVSQSQADNGSRRQSTESNDSDQVDVLKSKLRQLVPEWKRLKEAHATLTESQKTTQQEVIDLRAQLLQSANQIEISRKSRIESEQLLQRQIADLSSQLDQSLHDLERIRNAQNSPSDAQQEQLRSQIRTKDEEMLRLKSKLEKAMQRPTKLELQKAKREASQLQKKLERDAEVFQALQDDLRAAKASSEQVEILSSELQKAERETSQLRKKLESDAEVFQALQDDLKDAKASNEQLELLSSQLMELQAQFSIVQASRDSLIVDGDSLDSENRRLHAEIDRLTRSSASGPSGDTLEIRALFQDELLDDKPLVTVVQEAIESRNQAKYDLKDVSHKIVSSFTRISQRLGLPSDFDRDLDFDRFEMLLNDAWTEAQSSNSKLLKMAEKNNETSQKTILSLNTRFHKTTETCTELEAVIHEKDQFLKQMKDQLLQNEETVLLLEAEIAELHRHERVSQAISKEECADHVSTVQSLSEELELLRDRISLLQSENNEKSDQIQSVAAELRASEDRLLESAQLTTDIKDENVSEMRNEMVSLQGEISRLRRSLHSAEEQHAQDTEYIANHQHRIELLEEQVLEVVAANTSFQRVADESNAELQSKESELRVAQDEVKTLKKEVASSSKRLQTLREKHEAEIHRLSQEIAILEIKSNDTAAESTTVHPESQVSRMVEDLTSRDRKIAELEEEFDAASQQNAELSSRCQSSEQQLVALEMELEAKSSDLDTIKQSFDSLKKSHEDLMTAQEQVEQTRQNERALFESQCDSLQQAIRDHQQEIEQLRKMLQNQNKLLQESDQLKQIATDRQAEIEALTAQLDAARASGNSESDELKSDLAASQSLIEELEVKISVKQEQFADQREELNAKNVDLNQQVLDLDKVVVALQEDLSSKEEQLNQEAFEHKQSCTRFEEELGQLRKLLSDARRSSKSSIEELQAQLSERDDRIVLIQNQLEQRKQQLQSSKDTHISEVKSLRQQLESARSEAASLHNAISVLEDSVASAPSLQEIIDLKQQLSEKNELCRSLREKSHAPTSSVNSDNSDPSNLNHQLEDHQKQLALLRSVIQNHEATLQLTVEAAVADTSSRYAQEISSFKEEILDKESQLAALRAARLSPIRNAPTLPNSANIARSASHSACQSVNSNTDHGGKAGDLSMEQEHQLSILRSKVSELEALVSSKDELISTREAEICQLQLQHALNAETVGELLPDPEKNQCDSGELRAESQTHVQAISDFDEQLLHERTKSSVLESRLQQAQEMGMSIVKHYNELRGFYLLLSLRLDAEISKSNHQSAASNAKRPDQFDSMERSSSTAPEKSCTSVAGKSRSPTRPVAKSRRSLASFLIKVFQRQLYDENGKPIPRADMSEDTTFVWDPVAKKYIDLNAPNEEEIPKSRPPPRRTAQPTAGSTSVLSSEQANAKKGPPRARYALPDGSQPAQPGPPPGNVPRPSARSSASSRYALPEGAPVAATPTYPSSAPNPPGGLPVAVSNPDHYDPPVIRTFGDVVVITDEDHSLINSLLGLEKELREMRRIKMETDIYVSTLVREIKLRLSAAVPTEHHSLEFGNLAYCTMAIAAVVSAVQQLS